MRFFVKLCVVIMGWSNSTSLHSPTAAIGNKIVETLYSNRVTSENIRIHAHPSHVPSIQSWGVCCFLRVAWTMAQHCMEGMGEDKLYFPLLKSGKRQKALLGWRVSTDFVAYCGCDKSSVAQASGAAYQATCSMFQWWVILTLVV